MQISSCDALSSALKKCRFSFYSAITVCSLKHLLIIYLHILTQLGTTAVGEMPGIGRETGRGMCQEFGNRIFLVQDYLRRGTVDRRRSRTQMVDCALPLAQLGRRFLHRHEGHTVVRQSKIVSHSELSILIARWRNWPRYILSVSQILNVIL